MFGAGCGGGYNQRNLQQKGNNLACPFFVPIERADDLAFPHPVRLPLGAAWRGSCSAPGCGHATPTPQELEGCNLGYAKSCSRLPKQRECDAVRFAVLNDSGGQVSVQFVFEAEYRPAGQGLLQYDSTLKQWTSPHSEARIHKLADCFLQGYLERRNRSEMKIT
jgi:hypothetical protein